MVNTNSPAIYKSVGGELSVIGKSNPSVPNLGINILHKNLLKAYQIIEGLVYRRNPCEIRFDVIGTGVVG